jgi:uncharacterized protein (DUF2236 family)
VPDPPRTEADLTARIASYRAELAGTAQARAAARFLLLTPPLPAAARPPYTVLAAAAVSLLPGWARRPLRLPRLPATEAALINPAGHALVHAIRWATTRPRPPPPASTTPKAERPSSRHKRALLGPDRHVYSCSQMHWTAGRERPLLRSGFECGHK